MSRSAQEAETHVVSISVCGLGRGRVSSPFARTYEIIGSMQKWIAATNVSVAILAQVLFVRHLSILLNVLDFADIWTDLKILELL